MTTLRLAFFTFAVVALAAPRAQAADPLTDALNRGGVQPVMPVTEAVDFTLADLDGGDVSLSDFQGKWVLLTFWATWCGPCISEMPSLERFWEEFEDDGFAVVAVAVGSPQPEVQRVVQRNHLSFPVLVDAGDRVATRYRAWSVPLTYLVDPAGQLVGVVRGARDWSRAGELVRELRDLEVVSEGSYPQEKDEPVELPPDLVPPTVDVVLAPGQAVAQEPFELQILVRWADTGEDYRIHPPRLDVPAGMTQDAVSTSSSSQDGIRVLTYLVSLTADEPGSYVLDPVEVRFTPAGGSEPLATRVAGPAVIVSARFVSWPIVVVAVIAPVAVVALVWWSRRNRTR